jgi:hypothetical protein
VSVLCPEIASPNEKNAGGEPANWIGP